MSRDLICIHLQSILESIVNGDNDDDSKSILPIDFCRQLLLEQDPIDIDDSLDSKSTTTDNSQSIPLKQVNIFI
jgi:hypothetical protein